MVVSLTLEGLKWNYNLNWLIIQIFPYTTLLRVVII